MRKRLIDSTTVSPSESRRPSAVDVGLFLQFKKTFFFSKVIFNPIRSNLKAGHRLDLRKPSDSVSDHIHRRRELPRRRYRVKKILQIIENSSLRNGCVEQHLVPSPVFFPFSWPVLAKEWNQNYNLSTRKKERNKAHNRICASKRKK